MAKQRTGWFFHFGGPRGADGKRDFVATILTPPTDDAAQTTTPCLLGQGVDPAAIPLDPEQVTDEMYDRFNAAQRRHWSHLMTKTRSDWTPYPA